MHELAIIRQQWSIFRMQFTVEIRPSRIRFRKFYLCHFLTLEIEQSLNISEPLFTY